MNRETRKKVTVGAMFLSIYVWLTLLSIGWYVNYSERHELRDRLSKNLRVMALQKRRQRKLERMVDELE